MRAHLGPCLCSVKKKKKARLLSSCNKGNYTFHQVLTTQQLICQDDNLVCTIVRIQSLAIGYSGWFILKMPPWILSCSIMRRDEE